jgi:hypothetical protein
MADEDSKVRALFPGKDIGRLTATGVIRSELSEQGLTEEFWNDFLYDHRVVPEMMRDVIAEWRTKNRTHAS